MPATTYAVGAGSLDSAGAVLPPRTPGPAAPSEAFADGTNQRAHSRVPAAVAVSSGRRAADTSISGSLTDGPAGLRGAPMLVNPAGRGKAEAGQTLRSQP